MQVLNRPQGPQPFNQFQQQQPQQYQQEEGYDDEGQVDTRQLLDPRNGATFYNQDESFLQWLFNFRKEAVVPLRNVWRGKEYDFDNHTWIGSQNSYKIMNEQGITWAISLIESYLSPVYIVSDYDDESYNFTMREAARIIWNNLCARWKEFGMKKLDIQRVAEEIESKVRSILLGAKDNGYRDFFSTQNQNIETRNLTPQYQEKQSIWSGMANMFKKNQQMGEQQRY